MSWLGNTTRRIFWTLLTLTTCVGIKTGYAQSTNDVADLSLDSLLDNVVVAASKHEETLEESPANVYIVTQAMIRSYGCQTISEALELVPGLCVTDDYSLTQIGIRGLSTFGDWNSHVMILIDGHPTNEQYGGTSSLDVIGLSIDNVERIEVIKGPASSLYGSNAFLGIVNLITKRYDDNTAEVSGNYLPGTDSKQSSVGLYHRFDRDWSLYVSGSVTDRGGSDLFFPEFSDPTDSTLFHLSTEGYNQYYLSTADFTGGWAREKNTQRNFSTHSRLGWRNFGLTAHYAQTNTGVAHSMWGSLFQSKENRYWESRGYVDLDYSSAISERIGLSARLSYNSYNFSDYILYNYASLSASPEYLPGPLWRDYEYDRSVGAEFRLDFDFSRNHRLIFGSEAQFHEIGQESGATLSDHEHIAEDVILPAFRENEGKIYNLYLQDEYRLSKIAKLVGGMHFNYYTYTTGRVAPKAALILTPYDRGNYKFIASQGFRSPSFYELTFDDGYFYHRNPDLKSELITSYEVIASHRLSYGVIVDVGAVTSKITDMIQQTQVTSDDPAHPGGAYGEEVFMFRNTGRTRVNNLELAVRTNAMYRWSGFANITWQEVETEDDAGIEQPVFNSPRWLANFAVSYQLIQDRLTLATKTLFVWRRLLWDGTWSKEYGVTNLMVKSSDLIHGLEVGVGVKNLFDIAYRTPLSFDYAPSTTIEQPGRSIYVTAQLIRGW